MRSIYRQCFLSGLLLVSLWGSIFRVAWGSDDRCSALLLRWASAERMSDFWREIKSDRVLAKLQAQKFLTWVMASAIRIDREKIVREWENTVRAEFAHTWQQRTWRIDYPFFHLMGNIIYGIKDLGEISEDLLPLVLDLHQAHAWGLLAGAHAVIHHIVLDRNRYLETQRRQMKSEDKQENVRAAEFLRAHFDLMIQEVFQAFNSLIPNQAILPREGNTLAQKFKDEVVSLGLRPDLEQMILRVLAAKLAPEDQAGYP